MFPILIQNYVLAVQVEVSEGRDPILDASIMAFNVGGTDDSSVVGNNQLFVMPPPYILGHVLGDGGPPELWVEHHELPSCLFQLLNQFLLCP